MITLRSRSAMWGESREKTKREKKCCTRMGKIRSELWKIKITIKEGRKNGKKYIREFDTLLFVEG